MDNEQDIVAEETAQLPFIAFFNLLKSNGFSITTQQIIDANKIIINYSGSLKNEDELCLYLLPVFTGSEEEQLLFKQLFTKHFIPQIIAAPSRDTQKGSFVKNVKKHWKKILALYGLLALILITLMIVIYQEYSRPGPEKIFISVTSPQKNVAFNSNKYSVTPNQVLTLTTVCTDEKKKIRSDIELYTTFNWGDGSTVDKKNAHAYTLQGKYNISAFVEVMYKGSIIKYDTIQSLALVCAEKKSLQIEYGGKNKIAVNEPVVLTASFNNSNLPSYIVWISDGEENRSLTGYTYQVSFSKPGSYAVRCIAVYDSLNSPCSIDRLTFFNVFDPKAAKTDPIKNKDTTVKTSVNEIEFVRKTAAPFLTPLYILLASVFAVLALLFLILSEREKIMIGNLKKSALAKYAKLTASFSGKKTPGFIPFKNKNYVPAQQSEINYAARQMRKRVNDTGKFLHIDKTINKSIKNSGLFEPVLLPRTRQTEYLVLIDETINNSQLVKIFEYLLVEFKKQHILIEKYYYQTEPKLCYRLNEPGNVSLEKLATRYESYVLLIFGKGYQFIHPSQQAFDEKYLATLNRWQHKAILTPVPYPDWKSNEKKILLSHIPVFPLDVEGILLMAEYLSAEEQKNDIIARLNQHRSLFYNTEHLDFYNIENVESYCAQAKWAVKKGDRTQVNILLQWIAALAVYPKINWEVIIAIGKSILDRYDYTAELNFTNLLRIARISWMKEGSFPNAIRFELLKKLTPQNEVIARETILELFKEIPAGEIKESSQAYQEKEVQQVINEFSLFASDPVYYSAFKQSKEIFEKLWNEKRLNDPVAEQYLNNSGKSWQTIINTTTADDTIANVGLEAYYETSEKQETLLSKLYLWLCLISLLVCIASLFALIILYKWKTGTDWDPNAVAYVNKTLNNIF